MWHGAVICSLSLSYHNLFYEYTPNSLFILLLMDIGVVNASMGHLKVYPQDMHMYIPKCDIALS